MRVSVLVALVIAVCAAIVLSWTHRSAPAATPVSNNATSSMAWRIGTSTEDAGGIPHTPVAVSIDGHVYDAGTLTGTCSQIGTENSTALLSGEVEAVQCWWAGGGQEVGVFNENGHLSVKLGDLDEGSAETRGVRGNFKTIDSED